MQRIVVIGAQGQLGSALVREARARGLIAIAAGRRGGAEMHVDLESPATFDRVFAAGPQAIFLPGGFTAVDAAEGDPLRAERVNATAPTALARRASARGVRLVFFSTDYVFDGTAPSYREADTPAPLNVYGATKLAGERGVLAAGPHLVLRTSWLFGPDPSGKNFVQQLIAAAREGRRLSVARDQIACPTSSIDLARAALDLCARGADGLLHAAGPEAMSRSDFAALACDTLGLPRDTFTARTTKQLEQRAARPRSAVLDSTALGVRLGRPLRAPRAALEDFPR